MKNNNIVQATYFSDTTEFLDYIMDEMSELNDSWVSVVTDSDTAKELLFECMNEGYNVEFVDINDWEYDDLYYVTIDNETVAVEQAKLDDVYLSTDGEVYVDCSAEHSNEYISNMKKRFGDELEMHYVGIGGEDDIKVYEYENHYEDNNVYAEITVASNVKDYVNMVREFFEDYFCN